VCHAQKLTINLVPFDHEHMAASSDQERRGAQVTFRSLSTDRRLRTIAVAVALIGAIELWGLCRYFPVESWLTDSPLYAYGYALHFARGIIGEMTLRRHLRLWSYSPHLMAGYPAATRSEPMGHALALVFWIGAPLACAAILYKLFVIGFLLANPLIMALAARWLGLDWRVATISAALGLCGLFNYPGLLMIRAGMFGFLSASFLAVGWGAFVYRTIEKGRAWRFLLLGVSGGALTYLHPLAPMLLAAPAIGGLIEAHWPRRCFAVAAYAMVFAISLPWLMPLLFTLQIGIHYSTSWQTQPDIYATIHELFRSSLPFPPIAVFALAVYGVLHSTTRPRFTSTWLTFTLLLAAIAYFGSNISMLENLGPARFGASFYFYAVPFAALGVYQCWKHINAIDSPWREIARLVASGFLAYFALVSIVSVWLETKVYGPVSTTLPTQAQVLVGWIKSHNRDSRLILESGFTKNQFGGVQLPYFGADVGLLWALQTGRELIGGSPSENFSTFSFADFGNGRAFGRSLDQWRPEDFSRQLEIYNVGAALVWSPQAKSYLPHVPGVRLLQESSPYALYEFEGMHSFLITGVASSVEATPDCIQIKNAKRGRLLLKYHYFKTLRASPPMRITPVSIGNGDPNPFIQIDNDAMRDIQIYNAGFTGIGRATSACQ
jgi:hypothetical protein